MPGRALRSSVLQWVVAAITLLAPLAPRPAYAQGEHKHVLVLYSTRRDSQFAMIGESELPRTLDAGLARNLDYYAEFIDLTRFPELAYMEAFRDFLRLKYQGVSFDLVIAMQDPAVEFVNRYRETLFRDTPVVFLTNSPATTWRRTRLG